MARLSCYVAINHHGQEKVGKVDDDKRNIIGRAFSSMFHVCGLRSLVLSAARLREEVGKLA